MGPMEMLVILIIALIIFGPGRLPEIAAQIGKGIRDFKAATSDLTGEFQRTLTEVEAAAGEVKQSALEVQQTTQSAIESVTLDQAPAPATTPARPLPAQAPPAPAQTANGQRMPTKEDPLADLLGFEPTPEPREVPAQSASAAPSERDETAG
ncbi:MAG: twin-arginine translocase TatA/TatE family subunit [Thermomicrobiaceae bacterium]|nr:twin-arginine translocase TatA/TatE family subunit [Thermomicrobiaceae bacterium]